MLKNLLLAIATLSLATACSTLNEHENTARLTTQYATIKVIGDDRAKAQRVEEIATEVKSFAQDELVLTVDRLIDETRSQINWQRLDAADRLLVDALLTELEVRLKERFGGDAVPHELRLTVDKLADWVISAARMV